MPEDIAIGIDLGTSNSCVAAVSGGDPAVLRDSRGDAIHASVVAFRPGGKVVVGNAAKRFMRSSPEHTVYSAKRLIGRFFFSDEVKKAQSRCAYAIVEGPNSSVRIEVAQTQLSPSDVAALVLKKMRRVAENALGQPVSKAVITVPAYFNDNQRQATRAAGEIAGLEVLRIINEPTAAALAYGYGRNIRQRVAVYDLGGGTFDVSILEIGQGVYEVLSTAGDTYLGGDDFDARLVDYLANLVFQQHGVDPRQDRTALVRLTEAAELGKRAMSAEQAYTFNLDDLCRDGQGEAVSVQASLSMTEFSRMTMDLIQRTFKVCDEALQGARMTASSLDGVILVGGPTRLPFIRTSVEHYFQTKLNARVDPDEVVALGAALQGDSLLHGSADGTMLLDVTPLPLRLATVGGFTEEIIAKNTPVPIERSRTFTTVSDNQQRVRVTVLQGEGRRRDECTLLGEFEFFGLRPAPRGEVEIEVTFEIDADGIVNVRAKDTETGRMASTTIHLSSALSAEEIAASRLRTAEADMVSAADIMPIDDHG